MRLGKDAEEVVVGAKPRKARGRSLIRSIVSVLALVAIVVVSGHPFLWEEAGLDPELVESVAGTMLAQWLFSANLSSLPRISPIGFQSRGR